MNGAMTQTNPRFAYRELSDVELARLCVERDRGAIEHVITSNNQRLFRTAWSILKSSSEAEDAVQAAYVAAFAKIASFEGRSSLSTWLTRIVANEALGRRRAEQRRRRHLDEDGIVVLDQYRETLMRGSSAASPDAALAREQIRILLENAVAELPDEFRTVFVLRDVEGMTTEQAAEILDIPAATVKTRLWRSRRRLQKTLAPEIGAALTGTFPFAGNDCAHLTKRVLERLGL